MHQRSQLRATPMMTEHRGSLWWRCWRSSAWRMLQEERVPTWWQSSLSLLPHWEFDLSPSGQLVKQWHRPEAFDLIRQQRPDWIIEKSYLILKKFSYITLCLSDSLQLEPINCGLQWCHFVRNIISIEFLCSRWVYTFKSFCYFESILLTFV